MKMPSSLRSLRSTGLTQHRYKDWISLIEMRVCSVFGLQGSPLNKSSV